MFHRPKWYDLLRKSALINMHDGTAFDGVVVREDRELLFLANVTMHDPIAPEPVRLDGEVVIQSIDIKFVQLQ